MSVRELHGASLTGNARGCHRMCAVGVALRSRGCEWHEGCRACEIERLQRVRRAVRSTSVQCKARFAVGITMSQAGRTRDHGGLRLMIVNPDAYKCSRLQMVCQAGKTRDPAGLAPAIVSVDRGAHRTQGEACVLWCASEVSRARHREACDRGGPIAQECAGCDSVQGARPGLEVLHLRTGQSVGTGVGEVQSARNAYPA